MHGKNNNSLIDYVNDSTSEFYLETRYWLMAKIFMMAKSLKKISVKDYLEQILTYMGPKLNFSCGIIQQNKFCGSICFYYLYLVTLISMLTLLFLFVANEWWHTALTPHSRSNNEQTSFFNKRKFNWV